MIQLKNINYSIENKTLLQEISLNFKPNKINLILGPNGAGKSTLIKVISGQLKPKSGEIFYANTEINRFTLRELAKIRAVLSQNLNLAFPLTVQEVVMMGRYPHFDSNAKKIDLEMSQKAMALFSITNISERNFLTLSGGEKQRVHFARVFAQISFTDSNNKHYLILDEPLNSLDIFHQYEFMKIIQNLVNENELTVIGVLHDLNLSAKFADHIVLMHEGKIVATGNQEAVLTAENIKKVFRIDIEELRHSI